MCGRYTLAQSEKDARRALNFQRSLLENFVPRYNISPVQWAPVVLRRGDEVVLDNLKWGLLPFWAKDDKKAAMTINARIEGLRDESPTASYKFALQNRRRCIVPADGFYEWKQEQTGPRKKDVVKQPSYFRFKDQRIFGMAGLWQSWKGIESKSGEEKSFDTFTIITALPIEIVKAVHDRSPVILKPQDYEQWLDPSVSSEDALALLNPWEDHHAMEAVKVSREVSNIAHEGPHLIQAIEAEDDEDESQPEQTELAF